ncbi:hypothetical protein AVEN_34482-1, partial [Araneus ventricosus]
MRAGLLRIFSGVASPGCSQTVFEFRPESRTFRAFFPGSLRYPSHVLKIWIVKIFCFAFLGEVLPEVVPFSRV